MDNATMRDPSAGTKAHNDLKAAIGLALGAEKDVVMLNINVFVGRRENSNTWTRSAPKGTLDLLCCVKNRRTGLGLFVALDAKTGGGAMTKEQRAFRRAIETFGGGIAAEAHSVEDAIAAIERARNA